MRYRAFIPYSILGCGLWSAAHILIGYFFSRSIDTAAKYAGRGAFLLATLIVVGVGIYVSVRFLREPANRRRDPAPGAAHIPAPGLHSARNLASRRGELRRRHRLPSIASRRPPDLRAHHRGRCQRRGMLGARLARCAGRRFGSLGSDATRAARDAADFRRADGRSRASDF